MKNIFKTLFISFLLFVPVLNSQDQFTEQTSIILTGIYNNGYSPNAVAWGDYDNDNDMDIVLTGESSEGYVSKIYRNNGDNTFTEQTSISLTGVFESSAAWGDYDNDGDIDLLLAGAIGPGQCISKIYCNNGDNTFTEQTSVSLIGVADNTPCWGDYDNDGDLDILLAGGTGSGHYAGIYRNNGDNTFTEQTSISLTGLGSGCVCWGDYDNDGDLDILLTGWDGSNEVSKIYRNNGNNTFTEQTSISLTGVQYSSAAWGDYDNDGYLDILLTGYTGSSNVSKIYRNNGDSTFTEQTSISLTNVSQGSSAWGDYDNDGYLDILLTGSDGLSQVSKIYRNNGDNTFNEQTSISLTGVVGGSVAWCDYDNDRDLDILLAGWNGSERISKVYRNNNITPNTLPAAPANLNTSMNGNQVTFSWDKSTDAETPQNGLKYNLVIGTNPNDVNIMSPMSDLSTGYRRVINLGNTNHNNSWTIKGLPDGHFFWSVQALDNTFAGSEFAHKSSVIVFSTPAEGIYQMTGVISQYVDSGILTGQEGQLLNLELNFILRQLQKGRNRIALLGLGIFESSIDLLINLNRITQEQAQVLLDGTDNIIKLITGSIPKTAEEENLRNAEETLPVQFVLQQNYPNPFNPSTKISFSIPQSGFIKLIVYDMLGKEIAALVNEEKPAGNYEVEFNAGNLSSGIYIYRLYAGSFIDVRKMILLK